MYGIRLGVIVGDEDHAVRADAVVVIRRHLEIVAALNLHQEFAGGFAVFFFAQLVVVAEGGGCVEGVAFLGGYVLPFHAVDIGRAVGFFLIVGNDQRRIRVFCDAEGFAVFAEEMDGEILTDIDIAAVLRALGLSVCIIVKLLRQRDDAVNEILARGVFLRGGFAVFGDHDGLFSGEHFVQRERFAQRGRAAYKG